jgi:hypothetical protein
MSTQWNAEKLRGIWKRMIQRPLVGLDIGVSGLKAGQNLLPLRAVSVLLLTIAYHFRAGAITTEGEVKERDAVLSALKELLAFKALTLSMSPSRVSAVPLLLKKLPSSAWCLQN